MDIISKMNFNKETAMKDIKTCKEFLRAYRQMVGAKKNEKVDKGSKPYLAPNNRYYDEHCGYCAEVKYLSEIYK